HAETGQGYRVEGGFPIRGVALLVVITHGEGTGGDVGELTQGLHGDGWRHCSGTASLGHDRRRAEREISTGGGAAATHGCRSLYRSFPLPNRCGTTFPQHLVRFH